MVIIQGDSGGKVSILRGDCVGHCESKVYVNMCPVINDYRDRAVQNYQYKSTVNGNRVKLLTSILLYSILVYKWQVCYTGMINSKQFTIHVRKYRPKHNCTQQPACEDDVLFV
jgi:hypothetical protein